MSIKTATTLYIKNHKRYLDSRIAVVRDWLSISNRDEFEVGNYISSIINYLMGKHSNILFTDASVNIAIAELRECMSGWDIINDGDILGYIYQEIEPQAGKKSKGQFFTPGDIVDHLVDGAINNIFALEEVKILDPACGSGQFLLSAYRRLFKLYIMAGYSEIDAAQNILEKNLYALDIDQTALSICCYNLSWVSGFQFKNYKQKSYLQKDTLNDSSESNWPQRFDYIIGNPPWGSRISVTEKNYYLRYYFSAKSGVNTFTLFIERSLELLNDHGRLGFLIPEAFLNIKAHSNCRSLLLKYTIIKKIVVWGEQFKGVFAPSISLIVDREDDEHVRERQIVGILPKEAALTGVETLVPQFSFQHNHNYIFNIHYSKRSVQLVSQFEYLDSIYLRNKDTARYFLGIVTGNNEKYLSNKYSLETPDPIIVGRDLAQYKINYSQHYFKYDIDSLQQVAPQDCYLAQNKILYKFIGKRLTFALDNEGLYSVNNVNGFIPLTDEIEPECLVAILNSELIQYYYEKTFFTIKVLQGNLEKIPIKKIARNNRDLLINYYNQLREENRPEKIAVLKSNIDDIIFSEYGIKDRQAYDMVETNRQLIIPSSITA